MKTTAHHISISQKDRKLLRDLAKKVAEIASQPCQQTKINMWRHHNKLERIKPMVLVFPEGSWREMLPEKSLCCETDFTRRMERDLKTRIYYSKHLPDDNVIENIIYAPIKINISGWGLEAHSTKPQDQTGAYHIDPVINSEADVDKLTTPKITVDREETERIKETMNALFNDILIVKQHGVGNYGLAPIDHYATLRGIDNMFIDLVDNPGMVHKAISRIVEGHISIIKTLEEEGLLSLSNRNHYVGSGGVAYTDELPAADYNGVHVRPKDLWGFATAQIFSEVSPAMHEEFALQYERKVLELFGLNCYGCCEPLHLKLDAIFRNIPRLRRVSISPWADIRVSAEKIGKRCIFSWKPNPAIVAGETWNPEYVKKIITEFCEITRNCVVEIILKDTHTCRNHPERIWEWVSITQKITEKF